MSGNRQTFGSGATAAQIQVADLIAISDVGDMWRPKLDRLAPPSYSSPGLCRNSIPFGPFSDPRHSTIQR
jgi:hypothetical protein